MLNANIYIHTNSPVSVTLLTKNNSKPSNPQLKSIHINHDTFVEISLELSAKFYSVFESSQTAKYNHKKVKKILLEAVGAFKLGHYLTSYGGSEYKFAQLKSRNNQKVYFKLSGQARVWFDEIAAGTNHKNNKERRYVLFSLLEAAFLKYERVDEKVIN